MSILSSSKIFNVPSVFGDEGTGRGTVASYKPADGKGDIVFTRGSGATVVDNKLGIIKKSRTNYLPHSNDFTSGSWTTNNMGTLEDGFLDPFGGSGAWKMLSLGGQDSEITLSNTAFPNGKNGVKTFSLFAKEGTTNLSHIRLRAAADPDNFSVDVDLSNGTIGTTNNEIDAKTYDAGDGWWRISLTANSSEITSLEITMLSADNNTGGLVNSDDLFIYGAMLEDGLVMTDYIGTENNAVTAGVTDHKPRLNYDATSGCYPLMVEPSRANFFNQSEYFEGYTSIVGVTITTNTTETLSPEGLYNATKIEGTGSWTIRESIASLQNVETTTSFWVKAVDPNANNNFKIRSHSADSSTTFTATSEWVRYEHTYTGTASYFGIADSGNTDANLYIYGFQVEKGSYPTSYIPTYGATAQRDLENIDIVDNDGDLLPSTGSFFVDFSTKTEDGNLLYIGQGGQSLQLGYTVRKEGSTIAIDVTGIGTLFHNVNIDGDDRLKMFITYTVGEINLYINGALRDSLQGVFTPPAIAGGRVITEDNADIRLYAFLTSTLVVDEADVLDFSQLFRSYENLATVGGFTWESRTQTTDFITELESIDIA
jgi:hypothetical protein